MDKLDKIQSLTLSGELYEGFLICDECGETTKVSLKDPYSEIDNGIFCGITCKEKSRVTKKYKNILPEKYHILNTHREELLKEMMGKSLFIWGATGTGKSVFSASLFKRYKDEGFFVKWVSYPKFILNLQSSFKRDDDPFQIIEEVSSFPEKEIKEWKQYNWDTGGGKDCKIKGILFIDDLGAEKLTDFVRQTTYYILNEREEKNLLTIITSNFSLQQIDQQIDCRVSSRIAGMCEVLNFTGNDLRVKGK